MLGPLLHCIGKFIKINGFFDTLIETGTFGVKTAEEVVGGTHYVRSFRGMSILLEALLKRNGKKLMEIFSKTLTLISNDIKEI